MTSKRRSGSIWVLLILAMPTIMAYAFWSNWQQRAEFREQLRTPEGRARLLARTDLRCPRDWLQLQLSAPVGIAFLNERPSVCCGLSDAEMAQLAQGGLSSD